MTMLLPITPRQRQIVRMLVDGHSIVSAAAQLGIKEQVAKNHLRDARHRAGGMNTYALVARVAVEIYKAQWAKMRMG